MNAPVVTFEVAKRFGSLRRRYLAARVGIALANSVAALGVLWIALAAGDYLWEWSQPVRRAALAAGGGAIGACLVWRLYAILHATGRRQFVGRLETAYDGFGQRVRTVLDSVEGRIRGPSEMLSALGHQTLGRWETLVPSRLIPARALGAALAGLLAVVLLVLGLFTLGGDWRSAMWRAAGSPIPYTTLTVTPGDARLLEGSAVDVSLVLSGRTDRDVTLRYRELAGGGSEEGAGSEEGGDPGAEAADAWVESELLPSEPADGALRNSRRAVFSAGLGQARRAIEYQFVTSVGNTRIYRIDVQPLIDAERIETVVEPPEYTGLERRSFASPDVTVLEQSRVTVTIQTNHPLAGASLQVGSNRAQLKEAAVETSADATRWSFDLPSDDSRYWYFSGEGRDGTPMTPVKGRLRVRTDQPPTLAWRDPSDEIRVHTLAELPMRVHVTDDYGLAEAGIVFQLGDEEYVLTDWSAEDRGEEAANTTRRRLEETLPLESFGLSQRDFVAYYAYAVDNRTPDPQRSESDVRYVDIRPLRQFYSEQDEDPEAQGGGRVVVQLSEIIRRQRFLINRSRRLVRSPRLDLSAELGKIDRMVDSQSELAGLTRFLAEFFVSRGNDDVEALHQAEAAMLQAADSLAAGTFDVALAQEEDALRALAEARRALEIVLARSMSPAQRQELRQLARQLQQKLRRDLPESERQIADTLQRLAAEQARLGQSATRITRQQASRASGTGDVPPDQPPPEGSSAAGAAPQPAETEPDEPTKPNGPEANGRGGPPAGSETANGDGEAQPDGDEQPDDGGQPGPSGEPEGEPDAGGDSAGEAEPRSGDEGVPGGGASDEESVPSGTGDSPSLEEQQQTLFASQTELLERLQAIENALGDRLNRSPLMAGRMREVADAMDRLATDARRGRLDAFPAASDDAAEQLREIGIQLDALAASEPVARVSAIRDMTTSLANTERRLAEQLRRAAQPAVEPADAEPQPDAEALKALGTRMRRRAETVEDVLKAPADAGDIVSSDVNDSLERFAEEVAFLEQLAATRQAAGRVSDEARDDQAAGEEAFRRAIEYAEAARQLEDLYRQLVTPRRARLRQIEQQAGALAEQMGGDASAEESPEAKAGVEALQADLQEEGLGELAELLESVSRREGPETTAAAISRANADGFDPTGSESISGRVLLVAQELQERIQEMILLEIAADRDAPVPAEFRAAVDRYFRAIAGGANTIGAAEDRGR